MNTQCPLHSGSLCGGMGHIHGLPLQVEGFAEFCALLPPLWLFHVSLGRGEHWL